jgi:hypothetical protein
LTTLSLKFQDATATGVGVVLLGLPSRGGFCLAAAEVAGSLATLRKQRLAISIDGSNKQHFLAVASRLNEYVKTYLLVN